MKNSRFVFIWLVIIIFFVALFNLAQFDTTTTNGKNISFSDFVSYVEAKQVSGIKITGRTIEGQTTDGMSFSTYALDYPNLLEKLYESGASIEVVPLETKMNTLASILISWFPMLLFIGVWIFFMRQMGGAGKAMGFGKSKAKLMVDKGKKITFKDVAGIDEAKGELYEIVEFLKDPQKFYRIGGRIPKGCLLIGPPGTGKTMLAKAIAGEANVAFFSISGSDFVEMFVGVGASRVRDMFEQAKKSAPCIIFIDEIDAVGRHRGIGIGGGNDEREQTLNQLLVEMDGFESNEGIVIIAATNRPDVLDKALLRPGRFDRQITVNNPDLAGREQILSVHMRKVQYDTQKVDLRVIARGTPGFSGAALANLVNEAALLAAKKNKRMIDMRDMEEAKDKILMGVERKAMVLTQEEKKLTAYHEAGHAIVGIYAKDSDPIHKATIIPRGRALGMVTRLPVNDRNSESRARMEALIAVAMAGRVAEELIFGHEKVTSGASSDIKMATNIATAMVTEWGLSAKVGPVYYGSDDSEMYRASAKSKSEKTLETIDQEIRELIEEGYRSAKNTLNTKINELHLLAEALIEYETLTGDQIKKVIAGEDIKDEKEQEIESRTHDYRNATKDNISEDSSKTHKDKKKDW